MQTLQMDQSSTVLALNEGGTFAEETRRGLCRGQMDSNGRFAGAIEAFPCGQHATAGPFGEKRTELNESARGRLTVRELQSRDVEGASSDSDGSLAPRFSVMRAWHHASAPVQG